MSTNVDTTAAGLAALVTDAPLPADAEVEQSPLDREIVITRFRDQFASSKQEVTTTLRAFVNVVLSETAHSKERLPWLSLARFGDKRTPKHSLRHDANVIDIDGVAIDYDGEKVSMDEAADMVRPHDVAVIFYTSPSHTAAKPRWRAVLATSTTLSADQQYRLIAWFNGVVGGIMAPESFDLSRAYYYGSVNGNPDHRAVLVEGRAIDLAHELDASAVGKDGKAGGAAGNRSPGTSTPKTPGELAPPAVNTAVNLLNRTPNPLRADREVYKNLMLYVAGLIWAGLKLGMFDEEGADRIWEAAVNWAGKYEGTFHNPVDEWEKVRNDWSKRTNHVSGWPHLVVLCEELGAEDTAPLLDAIAERDRAAILAVFPVEPDLTPEEIAEEEEIRAKNAGVAANKAKDIATPVPTLAEQGAALEALLSLDAWLARSIPEPDRLLGDVLNTTTRMFLAGRTGLGKSHIVHGIAAGVASGTGFMHWKSARPARVLVLDGEMAEKVLQGRLGDASQRLPEVAYGAGANLTIVNQDVIARMRKLAPELPPFEPLNKPGGQAFTLKLLELLEQRGRIDLIILDNVMSLTAGDQKDEVCWSETMQLVHKLSARGIAQIWVDHTGWSNNDRPYGSATKLWQFDVAAMIVDPKAKPAEGVTAFDLKFIKTRHRCKANWDQFADLSIRLDDNGWTYAPLDTAKVEGLKPFLMEFYEAFETVLSRQGGGPVNRSDWMAECVRQDVLAEVPNDATVEERKTVQGEFRARISNLKAAGWIATDAKTVTRGPKSPWATLAGPRPDDDDPADLLA